MIPAIAKRNQQLQKIDFAKFWSIRCKELLVVKEFVLKAGLYQREIVAVKSLGNTPETETR